MELTGIDAALVKRLLNVLIKQGQPRPDDLQFSFIEPVSSDEERFEKLIKAMKSHTQERVNNYRQVRVRLVYGLLTLEEQIRTDARSESMELRAWSALYHRFFCLDELSPAVIWQIAGIQERRFQRRIDQAAHYLARHLRDKEQDAHRNLKLPVILPETTSPETRPPVGPAARVMELVRRLLQHDTPAFVSVEGLGGIGKTALARAAVEHIHKISPASIKGIIWLSARHEIFTEQGKIEPALDSLRSMDAIFARLTERLRGVSPDTLPFEKQKEALAALFARECFLIVIDNLETVSDVERLLPALAAIAGKSRFLLTSRISLQDFTFVQAVKVPELSEKDSKTLVFSELRRLNADRLLSHADASRIYQVVGGIPLALKLVTAQTTRLPLDTVLESIQHLSTTRPEERHELMFRYIYRRTWESLTNPDRSLLLTLYDVSINGTQFAGIKDRAARAGLIGIEFADALQQLQAHSLLEIHGSEPRYSLHRLTATFLQTDIIRTRWNTA